MYTITTDNVPNSNCSHCLQRARALVAQLRAEGNVVLRTMSGEVIAGQNPPAQLRAQQRAEIARQYEVLLAVLDSEVPPWDTRAAHYLVSDALRKVGGFMLRRACYSEDVFGDPRVAEAGAHVQVAWCVKDLRALTNALTCWANYAYAVINMNATSSRISRRIDLAE